MPPTPPALRARALTPLIEVVKPAVSADNKVTAPFPSVVQFFGQQDAPILPDTFRVYYGAFKLDITDRIAKYVTVRPDGFTLDAANIPKGKHRLTLQVKDEKQRIAERELRLEVE